MLIHDNSKPWCLLFYVWIKSIFLGPDFQVQINGSDLQENIYINYKARKFNIDTYWPQNDKLVFRMKFSSAPACIFLRSLVATTFVNNFGTPLHFCNCQVWQKSGWGVIDQCSPEIL